MEITPHVHSIPAQPPFFTGPLAPNVHLVRDGGEAALIDSGFSDEASLKARIDYLEALPGVKVRYILLTHHHFDHSSGAYRLRQASGAEVLMHAREEPFLSDWQSEIPQDIDLPTGQAGVPEDQRQFAEQVRRFREDAAKAQPSRWLEDGDTVNVGGLTIEAVHTPGHTLGSLCLYLREERALFTGDTVLGLGTVAISPPPYGDMALYLESLERLKSYDVAVLLPGHGPPVHEARRKIQELIDHRREREEQIVGLLAKGKNTVEAMLGAIYPELDRRIIPMARRQIEAHLAKLQQEGRVHRAGGESTPEYALI